MVRACCGAPFSFVCYTIFYMKIYSWNVNGIRAVQKKDLLLPFIKEHQPDVLCLQETKAQLHQVEEEFDALLPEYEKFWCSAERKGYSGTAIFTKLPPLETICGLPEDLIEQYELDDTYGNTAEEGRITAIELENCYIVTVYTPNAKEDLSRIPLRQHWDPAFRDYMVRLQAEKPVIFCGDLNVAHEPIDLARPKENEGKKGFTKEERSGFDAFETAGFVDTLRSQYPDTGELYTWWSHWGGARERNVGWRIDYVMVSAGLAPLVKNAKIHPDVLGSDHCPVSIDIAL